VLPAKTRPRAKGNNGEEWCHAIRMGEASFANFDCSSGLVEFFLTGLLTSHVPRGKVLEYDARNHRVTDEPAVNSFLTRRYRAGYEVSRILPERMTDQEA
jgi:hypothetical protein